MARFLGAGSRQVHKEAEAEDVTARLVTVNDPTGPASEAYRTLRTYLLYGFLDDQPEVIVVTSPGPGEGKSTTCANLGVVLAQANNSVLILDCDLRRPAIHRFFGVRNASGITDVLAKKHSLQDVSNEPVEGLKVVCVGPLPPNPADILGSRRFSELIASVREEFDYVLIDASPIGIVSDPAILATQGDGVLLVVDTQHTRKVAVRQAVRSLQAVDARILGTVMNNVKATKDDRYYGYTYKY